MATSPETDEEAGFASHAATAQADGETEDDTLLLNPPTESSTDDSVNDGPAFLLPLSRRVHRVFSTACHTLCALLLHLLSHVMLILAVCAGVFLQQAAFYSRGPFNLPAVICAALYAPSLAAVAVIRASSARVPHSGVAGIGPSLTHSVTLAACVLTVCAAVGVVLPLFWSDGRWISVFATVAFYYLLLVSEVLHVSAVNLANARRVWLDTRRGEHPQPAMLVASYDAVQPTVVGNLDKDDP